jgi:hypothetical protein
MRLVKVGPPFTFGALIFTVTMGMVTVILILTVAGIVCVSSDIAAVCRP